MQKFRKKPVVISAIQVPGYGEAPSDELMELVEKHGWRGEDEWLIIPTLEGDHIASPGDWIIQGVAGEFYPCKPDIFEATYEPVTDGEPVEDACDDGWEVIARSPDHQPGTWAWACEVTFQNSRPVLTHGRRMGYFKWCPDTNLLGWSAHSYGVPGDDHQLEIAAVSKDMTSATDWRVVE